jgi:hypothetical protein
MHFNFGELNTLDEWVSELCEKKIRERRIRWNLIWFFFSNIKLSLWKLQKDNDNK